MIRVYQKGSREISPDTLIVSADIGSRFHTGYLTTITGKKLYSIKFDNNRAGFDSFWEAINREKDKANCKDILFGFEPTGPYGEPLAHYFLNKSQVFQVNVNPMHTKVTKNVCDNTPLKSDEKDAKVISDIIRLGRWVSHVVPTGAKATLRRYINLREKNIRDRTAHYNRLRQQHYVLFPEFSGIIKDIKSKTALYLLRKYVLPEEYSCLNANELGKELRKVSRGKFGIKQAEALIEASKTSVGIKPGADGILFEIRQILDQLDLMKRFITEIEDSIKNIMKSIPESENIQSIKGIGVMTAAIIISEVGDFSGFQSSEEIIKFAGLNLFEISSGLHKGQIHITKVGRSLLRKTLFFAALNTVRKGGIMHDYYQKLIKKGKPKTLALIAVSRKLTRKIFALVRDDSKYIEDYYETRYIRKAA